MCTVLDPRYKLAVFKDENYARSARKKVQDLPTDLIASNYNDSEDLPPQPVLVDKFSPWKFSKIW